MKTGIIAACIAAGMCVGVSHASFITNETEDNDTSAAANMIGAFNLGDYAAFNAEFGPIEGGVGDVDWYKLDVLPSGSHPLLALTIGLDFLSGSVPDPAIALFDSSMSLLFFNDDLSGTPAAGISYLSATPGTYFIAVTGKGDVTDNGDGTFTGVIDGSHTELGFYNMQILLVPAPGSAALAAFGGLLMTTRQRRARG